MKAPDFIKLFVLVAGCICFASCSSENDDNEPKLPTNVIGNLSQESLNFTETAGEQQLTFTANADWTVSVAETRSGGSPWCTVTPTSGKAGTHTLNITTSPNESYDDRSVSVTLKAGNDSKSFVVTQKQKDAILLTSDKFEIGQGGGNVTIEVKSNVNYTATIDESCKGWISEMAGSRALETTTKKYVIDRNEEGEKREGTIVFSDGVLSETVHIYQSAEPIILLSANKCYVSASGEEITVELKSNCDYEVLMPSADWVKESSTRSMSSHTLRYTVAPNDSYDSREAMIIYRNKDNYAVADTLTIRQAQKDAIILSEKNITVGNESCIVDVTIDANVDFEMQIPDVDWISEVSSRSLTTHKKQLQIAENLDGEMRKAQIFFKNTSSRIADTLTVIQSSQRKRVKVHVEKPGTLSDYIDETDKYKIEELEVSGNLGGLDIALICDMAGREREGTLSTNGILKRLDISKATIIGDGEYYVYGNWGSPYAVYSYPKDNVIGDHMFASTKLESIVLPDNVTEIEHDAFLGCRELSQIVIPDGVKKIGQFAFLSTPKLKSVTIPRSMNTIEKYAFSLADGLTEIRIPGNIKSLEDEAFTDCENLTSIIIENGLENIGSSVFSKCKNLESIVLPESVSSIGENCFNGCDNLSYIQMPVILYASDKVFANCSGLKNVVVPEGVTAIGDSFFMDCTNLESISFPNTLNKIGSSVFWGCTSLSGRIEIPSTVSYIGGACFRGCHDLTISIPAKLVCEKNSYLYGDNMHLELVNDGTSSICSEAFSSTGLVSITIPDCITSIGEEAFAATGLREVTIPNSVTTIKQGAFMGCENLTEISLSGSISSIGAYVFNGCSSLKSIIIPDKVTSIGAGTFSGCTSLADVSISNNVVSIANNAFAGCTSLESIVLPDKIQKIESRAFSDCTALADVTIPNGITAIEYAAFGGCTALRSITLPNSITSMKAAFYGCSNLSNIKIPNHLYASDVFSGTGITSIVIPNGTTAVGSFSDCTKLASVTFPGSGVESFAGFENCTSLTNITIPEGVTSIATTAFSGCTSLRDVAIPESVVSLGTQAFRDCKSLTSITIPDGVRTIGDYAFADCSSLTTIILGSTVNLINEGAFHGAPVRQVQCHAVTPPVFNPSSNNLAFWSIFDGQITTVSATLYVPNGTGSAYTESDWGLFFTNIEESLTRSYAMMDNRTEFDVFHLIDRYTFFYHGYMNGVHQGANYWGGIRNA